MENTCPISHAIYLPKPSSGARKTEEKKWRGGAEKKDRKVETFRISNFDE